LDPLSSPCRHSYVACQREGLLAGDAYSHGMARVASLAVAACAVLATACTAGHSPPSAGTGTPAQRNISSAQAGRPASLPPVQGAAITSGGCGATPLLRGSAPGWASSADPPPTRYALAERAQAAAFLFGYPLMAGNPRPYSDKILWVVASPRDGMPLRLTGHPLNAVKPVVSSTWPAGSTPGRSTPPKSKSLRQGAGSSPCPGTATPTPLTSGTSSTGSNRTWPRRCARARHAGQACRQALGTRLVGFGNARGAANE